MKKHRFLTWSQTLKFKFLGGEVPEAAFNKLPRCLGCTPKHMWHVVIFSSLIIILISLYLLDMCILGQIPWFIGGADTMIHWKGWCWSWNSNTLATWSEELTHLKRPWGWERSKAGGEGDERGWDGWMAPSTQWTWVWVNSGSWWWTGRPGVLQSMGSQRVRHNCETELNWTEPWQASYPPFAFNPSLLS